jgi:Rrf2 family protein
VISQTAEYALRAITCLATQYDKPLTTHQIAEAAKIPAGYLSKVLQSLARSGLVHSFRGLHGGFLLNRPPAELTVLDVVQAVDPIQRIRSCPIGIESHNPTLCPLHRRLDDAVRMVEEAFGRTTIAELLDGGDAGFPRPLTAATPEPPQA